MDIFGGKTLIKRPKEKANKTNDDPLPISSLSYSSIRDYLKCPLMFYYRHVMKLRIPQKQIELVFGSAVHSAFEAFHNGTDPFKMFDQEFDPRKLMPEERVDMANHIAEGKRFIQCYIDNQEFLKQVHGVHPEGVSEQKFFEWVMNPITKEILPVKMSGRLDRITTINQLIDFKTSSKPYTQDQVDSEMQPDIYYLQHYAKTKQLAEEFIYIVLVKGRKDPLQVLKTKRTKEQLAHTFMTADLVIKAVRGGQFPRGTGWKHKWCDCTKYEEQLLIK